MGERQMDKHIMQSKVGYLFSGLWREKGRRGERGTEADSLRGKQKRKEIKLEDEDQPVSEDRGGSGHGLSFKETGQSITHMKFDFINNLPNDVGLWLRT